MDHVMVFFSSYCDFVRVRNWFKASNLDYAEVSEYTKDSRMAKVSSNRASLVAGAKRPKVRPHNLKGTN